MPAATDAIARGLGATNAQLGITPTVTYRVYLRDGQYKRTGEITNDLINLTCVANFNDVGTWVLEASADSLAARLLTKQGGIQVVRDEDGVQTTVFSGFVWSEWGWTAKTFRAAGYSDEALLWAPARPTPALAGPDVTGHWPDAYDVRTGVASSIFMELVDANIGPAAPAPWAVPALTYAPNPLLGSTITTRGNLQPLLTILKAAATTPITGGLGFYLRQADSTAGALEFGVYAPPDSRGNAKFSLDLQTIQDYQEIQSAPEANHAYVQGGDGFDTARTTIAIQDAASIAEWGRVISTVVDKRGITTTPELQQAANEVISGVRTRKRVAVKPFATKAAQYGDDYVLGALVTVVTRGGETSELVRQVTFDYTPAAGMVITPVVGEADASDEEEQATLKRTISNRVTNLEQNWGIPDDSVNQAMLQADSVGSSELQDDSVLPSHLASPDTPAARQVPSYQGAGEWDWQTVEVLLDGRTVDNLVCNTLTVNSTAHLGNNPTGDTVTVDAVAAMNGAVTINNNPLAVVAAAGGGANGQVLAARYGAGGTVFGVQIAGATNPSLSFVDDGGVTALQLLDDSQVYQVLIPGSAHIQGVADIDGDVTLGNGGTEDIRVKGILTVDTAAVLAAGFHASGASSLIEDGLTIQDGVTVQTGDLVVSGGTFRHESSGNARIEANSTGLGLFGATPIARPTVVGSRGGNVALGNALTALANLGAITNSTTA